MHCLFDHKIDPYKIAATPVVRNIRKCWSRRNVPNVVIWRSAYLIVVTEQKQSNACY